MAIRLEPEEERSFSFTLHGQRMEQETIGSLGDQKTDDGIVLNVMRDELRLIPFGDYLKRYIYINSGMIQPFRSVPLNEYRKTLIDAFRDNGVPASMDGEAYLYTMSERWLEQYRVDRDSVLLLGFGLEKMEDEVNELLTRGLHDHMLDEEDPREGICRYCFRNRYGWRKMQQLRMLYEEGPDRLDTLLKKPASSKLGQLRTYQRDRELLTRLFQAEEMTTMKRKTRDTFQRLYEETARKIRKEPNEALTGTASMAEIERTFCPIVKRDRHGNLQLKMEENVRRELKSHCFTRQHLYTVKSGKKEPDRYDLLTLGFYLHTGRGAETEKEQRCRRFMADMNAILTECGYGPVYAADPYESFLMMAMASEDPMGTYVNLVEELRAKTVEIPDA